MKSFKEFYLSEAVVHEPSSIPEKTVEHIRLIMAEIIKEYGISSYVSFEVVNKTTLNVIFTGEDAKRQTDLINKVITKKYPFINISPAVIPQSITLTLFI